MKSHSLQAALDKEKWERKDLREAFDRFSLETLRLEKAYRTLQREFTRLQEQITLTQKREERILQEIQEALLYINQQGEIAIANRAAKELLKLSSSQIGQIFWECFSDRLLGFSMKEVLGRLQARELSLVQLKIENEKHEVEVSATPLLDEGGLIVLIRDLTELRQLEESVERNNRLSELGEMAAALAHEIRNPLGGIEGFASLLERDLNDQPEKAKMARHILSGTKSLNRLVTSVLNYARPLKLHLRETSLVDLIEEVIRLSQSKRVTFVAEREDYRPTIDPDLVKLALLNLVLNALQASPEETPVHITLTREGLIAIEDHGKGIPKAHLEKIFTPFFTTKSKGTGLGLSEAHKIISAHGGIIEIDSREDRGTLMVVKLV